MKSDYSILYLTREDETTTRSDVVSLFGHWLPLRGAKVHRLCVGKQKGVRVNKWHRGIKIAVRGGLFNGALNKFIAERLRDVILIKCWFRGDYSCVIIRDDVFAALVAVVCRIVKQRPLAYWMSFPITDAQIELVKEKRGITKVIYWLRARIAHFVLYKVILPYVDFVFVQSEQMKKDVINETQVAKNKLLAVPMGIDERNTNFLSYEKPSKKTFSYLGVLEQGRQLVILVDILAEVLAKHPDVHLLIVGDGNDRPILERKAKELGVAPNITITGFLPRDKAWSEIANSDICISPFYPSKLLNSTSPTKLIEYFYLKKPVVANKHPEQELVINGSGGGIIVDWSVESFSKAVIELFDSADKVKTMGQAGYQYAIGNRTYKIISKTVDSKIRKLITRE